MAPLLPTGGVELTSVLKQSVVPSRVDSFRATGFDAGRVLLYENIWSRLFASVYKTQPAVTDG